MKLLDKFAWLVALGALALLSLAAANVHGVFRAIDRAEAWTRSQLRSTPPPVSRPVELLDPQVRPRPFHPSDPARD